MKNQTLKLSLPAILLAAIILVPFLDKAFTIDDTVFLFEANHALSDPLHPTAFEMNWDRIPERVSKIVPTGPVMAWLLIPTIISGGAEWVAHGGQLAMMLIAIVATVSLAIRLGLSPLRASVSGLLLTATPTVLGMAGTAMPDVPAMALGAAGIDRLVAWRDDRKVLQGISAAFLLGVAPHARTHLILLVIVAVLLLVGDPLSRDAWKKGPAIRWFPIAMAALIMSTVAILTHDPAPDAGSVIGTLKRFGSYSSLSPNRVSLGLASNLAAFSIHWVLTMNFAAPWMMLRGRPFLKRFWWFVAATCAGALLLYLAHGTDARFLLALISGLGATCLIDVLLDAGQRRDSLQLTLGVWLILSLPAVIYVHFPSKYLVVSAPAAALLLARAPSANSRFARNVLISAVAIGASLGVAILQADKTFAEVGRLAAEKLVTPYVKAGRNVWYVGHWGFQWYAEMAGARCYNDTPPYPGMGDLIVFHLNRENGYDRRVLQKYTLLARLDDREPGGRIMSSDAGAGFYTNDCGYLPWAWNDDVNDAVELWVMYPRRER